MSYQIKDEDLQKGITLQLTAEQLDIIAGALESVCISLGEKKKTVFTIERERVVNNEIDEFVWVVKT